MAFIFKSLNNDNIIVQVIIKQIDFTINHYSLTDPYFYYNQNIDQHHYTHHFNKSKYQTLKSFKFLLTI